MWINGAVMMLGRGSNAQKSLYWLILRDPKSRVTNLSSSISVFRRTYGLAPLQGRIASDCSGPGVQWKQTKTRADRKLLLELELVDKPSKIDNICECKP